MDSQIFTLFHVAISLIGIVSGLMVAYGLVTNRAMPELTGIFLFTTAATSITSRVNWLEEESQTVRLLLGSREEGRMKGNMLTPAVATTPASASRTRS